MGLQGFLQEVLWVFEESFNEDGEVFLETFKGALHRYLKKFKSSFEAVSKTF